MMTNVLERLQRWYFLNCNGDWEHTWGVKIENIDNPGWMLTVDLEDSCLQNILFQPSKHQGEDENDWVHCVKEGYKLRGACGPNNLNELLTLFLDWAEKHEANIET